MRRNCPAYAALKNNTNPLIQFANFSSRLMSNRLLVGLACLAPLALASFGRNLTVVQGFVQYNGSGTATLHNVGRAVDITLG